MKTTEGACQTFFSGLCFQFGCGEMMKAALKEVCIYIISVFQECVRIVTVE